MVRLIVQFSSRAVTRHQERTLGSLTLFFQGLPVKEKVPLYCAAAVLLAAEFFSPEVVEGSAFVVIDTALGQQGRGCAIWSP